MSLPFVRAAQTRFEVHVCCSPAAEPIFRMVLAHEQVHSWRPPWLADLHASFSPLSSFRAIRGIALRLAALQASQAVCAWCDPRTGLLMSLTGVPSRIGFPSHRDNFYGRHLPWRRRQLMLARAMEGIAHLAFMRPLLTQRLRRRNFAQHHVEDWRQIANALGLELATTRPSLDIQDRSQPVRSVIRTDDLPSRDSLPSSGRPRIAIHPGASEVQKRWPLQHFVALGHALAERYDVCFIEPPELTLDTAIRDHFPVISTGNLAELANCLLEIDALIGNDAGVGHLADALGKPVITIFISSDPGHFAPFSSREFVISFDDACDVRPCFGRCTKQTLLCHVPASYDAVAARIKAILDRLFA
jgi:ADP-heptose:LPS heptosyltransferase